MLTTKFLKGIYTEARPIIERHLDDSELLAGLREVVAAQGGDWSSLKALITADVKDDRDEAGGGKRVQKILDKADYSAAYADMLGLAKMNETIFSADTPHDPETGEIIEPELPKAAQTFPAQESGGTSHGESQDGKSKAARPASVDAQVNDGRLAGKTSNEVVTAGETAPESNATPAGAVMATTSGATGGESAATPFDLVRDMPPFLLRAKPPPELASA